MSGRLIVLEGLDGSGKATQAALLEEALRREGKPVKKVSFPDYASDSSALVRMYLSGQFGSRPDDVNPWAASCFYAVDRYASYKAGWGEFYQKGGTVLADRYTTSAPNCPRKSGTDTWTGSLNLSTRSWASRRRRRSSTCGWTRPSARS